MEIIGKTNTMKNTKTKTKADTKTRMSEDVGSVEECERMPEIVGKYHGFVHVFVIVYVFPIFIMIFLPFSNIPRLSLTFYAASKIYGVFGPQFHQGR